MEKFIAIVSLLSTLGSVVIGLGLGVVNTYNTWRIAEGVHQISDSFKGGLQ